MTQLPNVFLFSGQGSQYFQMGRQLWEENAAFRRCMTELDEVLLAMTGRSVVATLYANENSRGAPFDTLEVTHPAIFMVEYAIAGALAQAGVLPHIVLGTSLGFFAAAAVAGAIPAADALRAVVEQAHAIASYCEPGGMLAVMEDPSLYDEHFLCEQSTLASINFATHFVVSARADASLRIERELKRRSLNFQSLPVRYAFHSSWIEPAKKRFLTSLQPMSLHKSAVPMLCCCEPHRMTHLSAEVLWNVVRQPIRFREAIAALEQQGPHRYIDAGPSGTLAAFLKYGIGGRTQSKIYATMTLFGVDAKNLAAVAAA